MDLIRNAIPQPEITGTGVVFRNGRPVIEDAWVASLTDEQREAVSHALEPHGFRIRDLQLEEIF